MKMKKDEFTWEADRIFPSFPTPNTVMDAALTKGVAHDLLFALSALQGIVNRKKPRILLVDPGAGEGSETWAHEYGLTLNYLSPEELLKKYIIECKGIVVYSTQRCKQFPNLAATVAAVKGGIPVSVGIYHHIRHLNEDIPVLEDLSDLRLYNSLDIYGYLYDHVWKDCCHRILFSLNPHNPYQMRDLASATGCATVWLDCRNSPAEKELYKKFLADMEPGASICTGWYTEERSGITTATGFGLSTVPSDFFENPTVYAQNQDIHIRPEPDYRDPENKAYVTVFVSDGDNIQYCQHYMRKYWDENSDKRGKVAVNWTISPALADVAPAILNYYYDHSTDKDCFVCGPSGMGYAMPNNTLDEDIPEGPYAGSDENFGKYCALSNRYFERTGLRAVTVWDNMTDRQREIYSHNAPYLYGLTVQLFTDDRESITSVADGLICKQLTPCYTFSKEHLASVLHRELKKWDKKSPLFLAAQLTVWGRINLTDLTDLEAEISEEYGGKLEFVRADEFFRMYAKAKGLPDRG